MENKIIQTFTDILKLTNISIDDIDTFIEVGSHNGEDAVEFSFLFQNARIYTFEANPVHLHKIRKRILGHKRITAYNLCVVDYDGEIDFYRVDTTICGNHGVSSIFPFDTTKEICNTNKKGRFRNLPPVKTKCISLDSWCDQQNIEKVDLLEIDVQGAELKVLNGFMKRLTQTIGVCIEENIQKYYLGQPDFIEVEKILKEAGFIKYETFGSNGWDQVATYVNKKYLI